MTLILSNPTDAQLNTAFAEYVAGWTHLYYEEGEDVDIDARELYPWAGMRGTVNGDRQMVPSFTEHLSTVLPWLEKMLYWSIVYNRGEHIPTHERYWVEIYDGVKEYEGCAPTPSRAAVMVLLLAHGITIDT